MKQAKGKTPIDCCDSIEVEENDRKEPKSCHPAKAAIENKIIYLGGAKWRIKAKDLTEIHLEDEEMVLKTSKLSITITQVNDPPKSGLEQWEQFRNRVQHLYDKNNGAQKVFGSSTTKKPRKAVASRPQILWDDAPVGNLKKRTSSQEESPIAFSDSSKMQSDDNSSVQSEGLQTDTITETDVTERRPVGKRLKHRHHKSSVNNDEDTDDEFMFESGAELTTPAAQRIVSPGTNSARHGELMEIETVEEIHDKPLDSSQRTIDKFFKTATANPKEYGTINTKAPKTPPRSTLKSRSPFFSAAGKAIAPRRSFDPKTNHQGTEKQISSAATSPRPILFATSPSPTRPSVQERRGQELFGSSSIKRSRHVEEDPIEDADSPPSIRRFQRKKLQIHKPRSQPRKFSLSRITTPPKQSQFQGLANMGNTCYLNSSLQMLYSCRSFMVSLAGYSKSDLIKSVVNLYQKLQSKNHFTLEPREIKEAIDSKTDRFEGYFQRDAHEFLAHLIDHIHEELVEQGNGAIEETAQQKETTDETVQGTDGQPDEPQKPDPEYVTDQFCLKVKARLECIHCKYGRDREEMHRCLSIDIASEDGSDKASVAKSLAGFFEPEIVEIKCEKCEHGTHARQTLQIVSKPKYLLLHLKRFIFTEQQPVVTAENQEPNSPSRVLPSEYTLKKNKAPVIIEPTLRLDPFLPGTENDEEGPQSSHVLQSIVYHLGRQASSGHYTASATRIVQEVPGKDENVWMSFDDSNSGRITMKSVTGGNQGSTAYLLLYELGGLVVPTEEVDSAAKKTLAEAIPQPVERPL